MPNTKGKGKGQGPQQGKGQGPQQGKGHGPQQGNGQGCQQGKGQAPPQGTRQAPPQGRGQGSPQAKDKARTFAETLAHVDSDIDNNRIEGFTTRWADRDAYVQKASLVHTVHEGVAVRKWACEQVAAMWLWFEREQRQKEDKNGNMVLITEWVAQIEVWGNYDLTDADLIHGCDMRRSDIDGDFAPYPDWIGKVHGDGTSGDMVTIVCANKLPIVYDHKWWCCSPPR